MYHLSRSDITQLRHALARRIGLNRPLRLIELNHLLGRDRMSDQHLSDTAIALAKFMLTTPPAIWPEISHAGALDIVRCRNSDTSLTELRHRRRTAAKGIRTLTPNMHRRPPDQTPPVE